jgi:phage virion morphogenesis protein
MVAPIINITYDDSEIRAKFQQLQAKLGDLTPAMKQIGEAMLLSTDDRFANEVDPSGIPWQANSPRTIAQKRAQGRINKILQSTGRLRSSITYQATRDRVVVGTNVKYAAKHQLGQGAPKREFLGVSEGDRQEIVSILTTFLTETS